MSENLDCNELSINENFLNKLKYNDLYLLDFQMKNQEEMTFNIPIELLFLNKLIDSYSGKKIIAILPINKKFPIIYLAFIQYTNIINYHHYTAIENPLEYLSIFEENTNVIYADLVFLYCGIRKKNNKTYFLLKDKNDEAYYIPIDQCYLVKNYKNIHGKRITCMNKKNRIIYEAAKRKKQVEYNSSLMDSFNNSKGCLAKSIIVVTKNKTINKNTVEDILYKNKTISNFILIAEYDNSSSTLKYFSKQTYGGNAIILTNFFTDCKEIIKLPGISVDSIYYEDFSGDSILEDSMEIEQFLKNNREIKFLSITRSSRYTTLKSEVYSYLAFKFFVQPNVDFYKWDERTKNEFLIENNYISKGNTYNQLKNIYWENKKNEINLWFVEECDYFELNQQFYRFKKEFPDINNNMGIEFQQLFFEVSKYLSFLRNCSYITSEKSLKILENLEKYSKELKEYLVNPLGKKELLDISGKLQKFMTRKMQTNKDFVDCKFFEIKKWCKKNLFGTIIISRDINIVLIEDLKNKLQIDGISNTIISEIEFKKGITHYNHLLLVSTFYNDNLRKILYSSKYCNIDIMVNIIDGLLLKDFIRRNDENTKFLDSDFTFFDTIYYPSIVFNKESLVKLEKITNLHDLVDNNSTIIQSSNSIGINSRIKKYSSSNTTQNTKEIMVNFVNGSFCFYKKSHKITKIDFLDLDKPILVKVEEIKSGEYLVVRESGVDLITSEANEILKKEGNLDNLNISKKWKKSLYRCTDGIDCNHIYNILIRNGCEKSFNTVKNWLFNEDFICPQNIADLEIINAICIGHQFDVKRVFKASEILKIAHISAGKNITKYLLTYLNEIKLDFEKHYKNEMKLKIEGIGNVALLKVASINKVNNISSLSLNKITKD